MVRLNHNTRARGRYAVGAVAASVIALFATAHFATSASAKTAPQGLSEPVIMEKPASFADLIEAVAPAVVNISTNGKLQAKHQGNARPEFQLPPNSPFRDFFEHFFNQPGMPHGPGVPHGQRRTQAQGSGFIIDPAGFVVTNYHVVEGAEQITVKLQSGTELAAVMRGFDAKTDLAVLKVESEDALPYVEFGDSDSARVGDWVLAIGNPFGLGGTATTGIISARGRDIRSGPLDDFLQIDAPINRGNSGGPLFDGAGKVIGVNTAIFSPNGGNVGIGFAIPSAQARQVVEQLVTTGSIDRGWLGVQIQAVNEEIAESLGLQDQGGALVASVVDDSPSAKAGIEPGDVILEYDGKPVEELRDLPRLVAGTPSDTKVAVKLWRAGELRTYEIVVGKSEGPEQLAAAPQADDASNAKLGLALAPLTDEERARHRLDADTDGVLVVAVEPQSPAARKGLRVGDVIKMVGTQKVRTPAEVVGLVNSAAKDQRETVLLLIERDGNDRFVAVKFA